MQTFIFAKTDQEEETGHMREASFIIDTATRFQTIDHFGASGAWSLDPIAGWSEESKDRIADLLFSPDKGIGLSVWRFIFGCGTAPVGSEYPEPDEWRGHVESFRAAEDAPYDWSAHAGQRWFVRSAQERGVGSFIGVVYSPPLWLTRNGKRSPGANIGSTNLKEGAEKAFAVYICDILEHFAVRERISFRWISPVNEPSWSWDDSGQEGNRYSNEDLKKIVAALDEELRLRELVTEIDLVEAAEIPALLDDDVFQRFFPEQENYRGHGCTEKYGGKYREYIKDLLGDPEIAGAIGHKLSYHAYWADHMDEEKGLDRLGRLRELLACNLRKYDPAAKLWQTEYCNLNKDGNGRDLGIDFALFVARVIHFDMSAANASSWQWWLALSPHDYKDGLIYTDYRKPGDAETVIPSKTLWALGHYSRFVRPGAVRVSMNGAQDPDGLMVSAYVHDADRSLTVVIVHYGTENVTAKLAGDGLPDRWERYVTSAAPDMNLCRQEDAHSGEAVEIPARSIVTLMGRIG